MSDNQQNTAQIDDEKNPSKQKTKSFSVSSMVFLVFLFILLVGVAWILTKAIENITKSEDNVENANTAINSAANVDNVAMLASTSLKSASHTNIETAFENTSKLAENNNKPGENTNKSIENTAIEAQPIGTMITSDGTRIETAFEKPASSLESIKNKQSPPKISRPPEQLQLDMQVNYEQSQWSALSQHLLELETEWKNKFQTIFEQFTPQLDVRIQTVKPEKIIKTRDTSWSDVLNTVLEMETNRIAMSDVFVQQLQLEVTALNQLSEKFANVATVSSWQQTAEQILALEVYRVEMLKMAQQCCQN